MPWTFRTWLTLLPSLIFFNEDFISSLQQFKLVLLNWLILRSVKREFSIRGKRAKWSIPLSSWQLWRLDLNLKISKLSKEHPIYLWSTETRDFSRDKGRGAFRPRRRGWKIDASWGEGSKNLTLRFVPSAIPGVTKTWAGESGARREGAFPYINGRIQPSSLSLSLYWLSSNVFVIVRVRMCTCVHAAGTTHRSQQFGLSAFTLREGIVSRAPRVTARLCVRNHTLAVTPPNLHRCG